MTPQDIQKIIELYTSGLGSDTIAKQFNIHPNSILKILKKNGIKRRLILRKKIQIEDELKIIEMYQQGLSAPKIAKKFNVQNTLILRYLEKNNINRRSAEECHRKYEIDEHFFDNIDTEEKAYFLGFLYADGFNCKESNYIKIELAQKDKDILQKLVKLIYKENPEHHIKEIKRVRKKKDIEKIFYYSYFTINSKYMCQKLEELGSPQKKSLIIKFPEWLTNHELQRHFIRGYFDGDGGVKLTNVKTRSTTLKIISTKEFCQSMKDIISGATNINFGEPYNDVKDKNVYTINSSGNRQIAHFLDWLYMDASIYLDRKYKLYQELLLKNIETDKLILDGTRGYNKRYYKK